MAEFYSICIFVVLNGLLDFRSFAHFADHGVIYGGESSVEEGDSFHITCRMPIRDPSQWTIGDKVIPEENDVGYTVSEKIVDTFHKEMALKVLVAQLHHEGEYRCNKYSRDHHYVNIIEQEDEYVYDDDDEDDDEENFSPYKPSNSQLLEVNRSISFFCSSAKDDETPITWYKNGRRIHETNDIDVSGQYLKIENAQEEDAGEYMCTVDSPHVTGFADMGRIFRLNSPARIIDFPTKINIIKGRILTLQCKVLGFPKPEITWYIGNLNAFELRSKDVRISIYSTDGGQPTSYLTIRDISESDRGLYTCRAENIMELDSSAKRDEKSVFVHVRENMIETNEDEPGMGKILIPGESLVLQCNTSECPHCRVIWYKDDVLLSPIPNHLQIFEENNSIIINHSTYNDSGLYVCAIDRKQLDVALNASILVQSEIKLEKFDTSSIVVQGNPLELNCIAHGSPAPSIKWFKGDEEIDGTDKRIKLLNYEGIINGKLLIEEADFEDRNHYTCEAYNQVNSVNTTIFIRIKDKLAALWPFLGICAEVAILCTIIFIYERRKSMSQCDEPETDLPTENKHLQDQKSKGKDIRQRK